MGVFKKLKENHKWKSILTSIAVIIGAGYGINVNIGGKLPANHEHCIMEYGVPITLTDGKTITLTKDLTVIITPKPLNP